MLISFQFSNFKSFLGECDLNLTKSSERNKRLVDNYCEIPQDRGKYVLKSVGVYGANASGKTNLIDAFQYLKSLMIRNETSHWIIDDRDRYFNDGKTSFNIVFTTQGNRYEYDIELNDGRVAYECLFRKPIGGRNSCLFHGGGNEWTFSKNLKGEKWKLVKEIKNEWTPLLSLSMFNNELNIVRNWILGSLLTPSVERILPGKLDLGRLALIEEDDRVLRFCKHFDIDPYKTSDSSYRLALLAHKIIDALDNGKVLIVDDLNFHPLVNRRIVEIFNSRANKENAQLIFTTHDSTLLDETIMRRDQFYLIEKRQSDGKSFLYSIAEFERDDKDKKRQLSKSYLSGRFGATPFINELWAHDEKNNNYYLDFSHLLDKNN